MVVTQRTTKALVQPEPSPIRLQKEVHDMHKRLRIYYRNPFGTRF